MSTKNANKKNKNIEVVKPIFNKRGPKETILEKITDWFILYFKQISLFVIGLIIGIVIMFMIGYGSIAKLSNGDTIVASVKGLDITANSLYTDLKDTYGLKNIITKIDDKILTDKYGDKKVDAEKYATDYITSLKSQYKDNWADFLSYYGFADDTALKSSLITQYYADLVTAAYVKAGITEDEINAYYKNEVVGDIKVSHILIKADYATDATEAQITAAKDKAKAKAEDLIKQLKASNTPLKLFVTLAKKNSDDESNASKGGDLGYFNKGAMEAAFETAAYSFQNVGDFTTTPVETTYGYHIIIKTAKTKTKAALADVKTTIITALIKEKTDADKSLPIKAMMELRNTYKLTFEEPKMKTAYDELMATNIKTALTKEDTTTTS